jgi:hypothetical protein
MNNNSELRFKTKTGGCLITPQQIILERQGALGKMSNQLFGNTIQRSLLIYGIFGVAVLAVGIWSVTKGDYVTAGFLGLVGAIFLWNVFMSRNNSATALIERSAIRSVEAHPPHPPLTRGYFVIWFQENGKTRRRLIMLPGSMSGGNEEYELALSIMRQPGLLSK